MYLAKFKLKDDADIYTPLCVKYKVSFHAIPITAYDQNHHIHAIVAGTLSGTERAKSEFVSKLRKESRVKSVYVHHDFITVHATHPATREAKAEIKLFYNPQYIRAKPILVSHDGWEYWEVACFDRKELNRLLISARKYYHGKIISVKQQRKIPISMFSFAPQLSKMQQNALDAAHSRGYYNYPRSLTLLQLAKESKKSYSTYQEHLSKAENKLIQHYLKYRL